MDRFLESFTVRQCAFGLIDPAMVDKLPEGMATQILVPKGLTSSCHLMPILLDLRRKSEYSWNGLIAWIRDEFKQSQRPPIALFVTTDINVDEFARHWNAIQLAQPTSTRKLWLRVHDPRVLHQLLRILNPAQRRRLFGKSQAFHYWLGGTWITAQRHMADESGNDRSSSGLAGWDWHRVEAIGLVNRALLGAGIYEASELTSQGVVAEQLIKRAMRRHGLTEQPDLVEFATRGLLTIPTFDEHPIVIDAIRAVIGSAEDTRLSDRFALIEEEVWKALRCSTNLLTGQQT